MAEFDPPPSPPPPAPGEHRDRLHFDDNNTSMALFGQGNRNLRLIGDRTRVAIHARGNELTLVGEAHQVALVRSLLEQLYALARRGQLLDSEDIVRAVSVLEADRHTSIKDVFQDTVLVASRSRPIGPKGLAQKRYVDAIRAHDVVFGIGPAGTGKTYLAMAMAVRALLDKQVKRIVLARPAVEAGEKLGFLPGTMQDKVNPYLRPLYDALNDMMDIERADALIERGTVEVAPLAFMRGRTLNDSFVILDEAQNTTSEQMKMFLTRLGFESKAVITGDVTQIDLPGTTRSGLLEARDLLTGIPGIALCYFTEVDVVRHPLVQQIIRAYDKRDLERQKAKESTGGPAMSAGVGERKPGWSAWSRCSFVAPPRPWRPSRAAISSGASSARCGRPGSPTARSRCRWSTMKRSAASTAPGAARTARPTCSPSRCARARERISIPRCLLIAA